MNVSEIFGITIQGEGQLIGKPTVFVRLGGCDYRCSWCDTMYSVDPKHSEQWVSMTAYQVVTEIEQITNSVPILVTISGGNPSLYDLEDLLIELRKKGYKTSLETQGSIARDWFQLLDYLTVSPKPPSAHTKTRDNVHECLERFGLNRTGASIKIPVFDKEDFEWAKTIFQRYPSMDRYISLGNPMKEDWDAISDFKNLLQLVLNDSYILKEGISVLPQLHVILWGNARGV